MSRPRSDAAHRAILDAALALAVEHGYTGVTIKGIAERAGVGRQTVYRWWPTRGAVLLEAMGRSAPPTGRPSPAATRWPTCAPSSTPRSPWPPSAQSWTCSSA
ncbi:TetR/AcrR family transcriptional regulator [Streptacidiphilus monticola]